MDTRPGQTGPEDSAARAVRAAEEARVRGEAAARVVEEGRRAELAGVAAAAVAHEVRNLLTPVRARIELALGAMGEREFAERCLKDALRGVERAGRAAEAVLSVVAGRVEGGRAEVAAAVEGAARWAGTGCLIIESEVARGVWVGMGLVALEQVVLNLLLNARAAMGGRGKIVVRMFVGTTNWVGVEVEDSGRGMGEGEVRGVFGAEGNGQDGTGKRGAGSNAGRESGDGNRQSAVGSRQSGGGGRGGVGLIVCRHLVEAVGGRMWARSEVGKGTVVGVELPRVGGESETAKQRDSETARQRDRGREAA